MGLLKSGLVQAFPTVIQNTPEARRHTLRWTDWSQGTPEPHARILTRTHLNPLYSCLDGSTWSFRESLRSWPEDLGVTGQAAFYNSGGSREAPTGEKSLAGTESGFQGGDLPTSLLTKGGPGGVRLCDHQIPAGLGSTHSEPVTQSTQITFHPKLGKKFVCSSCSQSWMQRQDKGKPRIPSLADGAESQVWKTLPGAGESWT